MYRRILAFVFLIAGVALMTPFLQFADLSSGKVFAQSINAPGGENGSGADASKAAEGDGNALNIVSWGGAYQMSQAKAYFEPFSQSTGMKITTRIHQKNDQARVLDGLENNSDWDIADLTGRDEQEACGKGLIKKLQIADIFPGGDDTAAEDFLPGAFGKCGIGSVAWSSVIVVNRRKFKRRQPRTVKDLFDVKKFPGMRALPKGPKYLLELALMADGVAAAEVYNELETSEGEDRAFEKLDKLRDHIVWWEHAGEALKMLENGRAVMAMAYNGRAFTEITTRMHPFDIIWDGQIYDVDYWVVSIKSKRSDAALKFLRYALAPGRLAVQARWFPYGPLRKSALPMVGKHAQLDLKMSPYLPTAPAHMKKALKLDTKWWAENEERLKTRFEAWIKGEQADEETGVEEPEEQKQASEQ